MTKFLMAALLSAIVFLPTNHAVAAKAKNEVATKKIIDCTLEDEVMIATSGDGDGPIYKIVIVNPARQIVYTQEIPGFHYYVELDLSFLPAGTYNAKVYAGNLSYVETFCLY